jgi:hypothetical protein
MGLQSHWRATSDRILTHRSIRKLNPSPAACQFPRNARSHHGLPHHMGPPPLAEAAWAVGGEISRRLLDHKKVLRDVVGIHAVGGLTTTFSRRTSHLYAHGESGGCCPYEM